MKLKHRNFVDLMGTYEGSGLNVTEFCRLHGISKSRFYKYRREQDNQPVPLEAIDSPPFERITLVPPSIPVANASKAVIYFPNKIHCEIELLDNEARLQLLKELASL